jgi:phosphoribosyl 1,2-cyclic phosphodiesterase
MKGFCPLASGSKGNSLYVGTDTTRILIDAGISAKALLERLKEINVELETIQAILVTHEHVDHIQGLKALCRQIGVPILTNLETAKGICNALEIQPRFKIFTTGESFVFGDLEIHPFSVPHDTLDPVAFAIKTADLKLGVCTDLGHVTSLVRRSLEKCDYLVLEANHQPSMVHASSRPAIYKQRVLGRQGHLSNEACANLLLSIFHADLKHVHLAHLSSECNEPNVALGVVRDLLQAQGLSIPLSIAHQEKISHALHF